MKQLVFLLLGSACLLQSQPGGAEDPAGPGYRTEGYRIHAGSGSRHYSSDYGHHHFTRPRYGNSAYHHTYHAHKDAVIHYQAAYPYAYPFVWHSPTIDYANTAYPARQAGPASGRVLLKNLSGQCYRLHRNAAGEELRQELPASECE